MKNTTGLKRGNIANLKKSINRYPNIPKEAGVYMVTNTQDNKSYIGSSSDMNRRLHDHSNKSNPRNPRNPLIFLDFNNCEFKVLENCKYLTKYQRINLELENIKLYNTVWPDGYNQRCPVTFKSLITDDSLSYKDKKPKLPRYLRKPYHL